MAAFAPAMAKSTLMAVLVLVFFLLTGCPCMASPSKEMKVLRWVGRHRAIWSAPPIRTPANHSVDGPLMGNGDMKVAVGGPTETQVFHLAKNDLWRLQSSDGQACPLPFGRITVKIPALKDATYRIEQRWDTPETVATFSKKDLNVRMVSMVAAPQNLFLVDLSLKGAPTEVEITMQVAAGRGSLSTSGRQGNVLFGRRAFLDNVDLPTGVAVAWKVLGAEKETFPDTSSTQKGIRFLLSRDRPVTLTLTMESLLGSKTYERDVLSVLSCLSSPTDLAELRRAHAQWWADYWAKSFVEIGLLEIEKGYLRSLYHMAACSRNPRFPPGLFGWVTTEDPGWQGDYHLNYNHMAPFYALYSANRIEQADPEDAPILDFQERGSWYAENVTGTRGVLYPVGIGPLGIETTRDAPFGDSNVEKGGLFWQQRSNSAYCLVNIAQRWRTTYDPDYGRTVYPFVRNVVNFWEDYLHWEDNRYVILGDAIHEGSGQDMNPILTLGLLRNAFDLALDMSEELQKDQKRRAKWLHILDHLSSWSIQEMGNREKVFRYTEKGMNWNKGNTLGIQHIYPGNALGLDSDPKWLEISQNTIALMGRWHDFNGSNSFFPAAVRVGYDPQVILDQLAQYVRNAYPNGIIRDNPHGIENYSTVPNTINEMLCMSHVPAGTNLGGNMLRVFPVWPKEQDARFSRIRTWGAFLVSSELKHGKVLYVRIQSERGRDCALINPWPGKRILLEGQHRRKMLQGERVIFSTNVGETIKLKAKP